MIFLNHLGNNPKSKWLYLGTSRSVQIIAYLEEEFFFARGRQLIALSARIVVPIPKNEKRNLEEPNK